MKEVVMPSFTAIEPFEFQNGVKSPLICRAKEQKFRLVADELGKAIPK
jgi:hypothetical protein